MTNLKLQPVGYRPFEGHAVLADGLLAVRRPGGEVQATLANAMFDMADMAGKVADRQAQRAGRDAGVRAALATDPAVTVTGGDRGPDVVSGGATGRAGVNAPAPVRDAIGRAAARHGQNPAALLLIGQIESGLDPAAQNPNSSAGGLYQFVDDTAAQYGLKDRFDPDQAADAAARLMRDNANHLRKVLGRDPTVGELYLAHQQGAGGAAALLKNPQADAASVVGARAVRLNGGKPGMTAGEFARLWTARAGDAPVGQGLGPMPTVDLPDDSALTVTPGVRSPLSIAVRRSGFAMNGRDTIFGRAFDQAAGEAFSTRLQDAMLSAADEISAKYADDPVGMADAFRQLKDAQLDGDVPDAIRLDYETAFGRVTRQQLRRAQDSHEKGIRDQEQGVWASNGTRFEDGVGRAQAGLDADDGDSLTVLQGQAARMKQHWREGVARGFITPKQAEDAAQRLDGEVQAAWYLGQAKGKTGDDIDGLRETLKADYAAGKLAGVDAGGWQKIDAGLQRAAVDARQKTVAAETKLGGLADDMLQRAALGFDIPAVELDALRGAAGAVKDGDAIMSGTLEVLEIGKTLRAGPVADAEKKLDDLRKTFGRAPSAEQVVLLGKAEAMVATARKALATDPLGYAERAGVIADAGSLADVKSADDLKALIAKRLDGAAAAAAHFGIGESFFRPGEVQALDGMVKVDPEHGASLAAALLEGAGTKAPLLLREFGRDAPVLAGAGAIMAGGGSLAAARDSIAGAGKDESGKAYSAKGWQGRKEIVAAVAGTALQFQPDDLARVAGAADRIARKRIAEAGVDPDGDEAQAIMERAVNEAAGATYDSHGQWGGFADYDPGFWAPARKVAVPGNIRADRLADVIDALKPDDVTVQPQGGMDRLQELWPVLTAQGYVFVDLASDGVPLPLAGADGKPFVLKLDGMGAKLGPRVPGAFRGW